MDRRDFLKYAAVSGLSLYFSGCVTPRPLQFDSGMSFMPDEIEKLPPLIKIVLDDYPTLSTFFGESRKEYPIVAGQKRWHPTPKGIFSIKSVIHKPRWYPPRNSGWVKNDTRLIEYLNTTKNVDKNGKAFVPYGHKLHPLGEWKIGFTGNYYIHGNGDSAINKGNRYASHGCIRMRDRDIGEVANFCKEHRSMIHII